MAAPFDGATRGEWARAGLIRMSASCKRRVWCRLAQSRCWRGSLPPHARDEGTARLRGGGGDDRRSTAARLRAVLWGGDTVAPEDVAGFLREAGFDEVVLTDRLSSGLVP